MGGGRSGQPVSPRAGGQRRWLRMRASLLPKILVVMLVAVTVGSLVTAVFETRATRNALRAQVEDLTHHDLAVARATLGEKLRRVDAGLREAAQRIALRDLTHPARRVELLSELEATRRAAGLDGLAAVAPSGGTIEAVGEKLPPPPVPSGDDGEIGASSLLVRTPRGPLAHVGVVPVRTDRLRMVLAGGILLGDATAFELRGMIGHDVVLLANGEVVGTTLAETLTAGTLPEAAAGRAPETILVDGREMVVAVAPLTPEGGSGRAGAAVAVAISDPVARLDRSLTRTRVAGTALLVLVAGAVAWLLFRHLTRPLRQLADTARRIAAGDLDASFAVRPGDEVGELGAALERMRAAIGDQVEVIRQQARMVRASTRRIATARDDERSRLARDLHDGLQQQLVMLRVRLGLLRRITDQDPLRAEQEWSRLVEQVDAAIQSLRETSQGIFPSILRDRGLHGALLSLAGRAPATVTVTTSPDPLPRLPPAVEAHAYFLVAEATTNAVKHGGADRIDVSARLEAATLRLRVADDGSGFDADDCTVVRLRDRAVAAGGHLDVSSTGEGAVVAAVLPVGGDGAVPGGGEISRSSAGGRTAPQPPGG